MAAKIETDDISSATLPQIAIDNNGNAIAVWSQSDGTRFNILANYYTAGSGWATAELIETDDVSDAANPRLAFDSNGNAMGIWYQSDGIRNNIWSNYFTAGSGWGPR